MRFPTIQGVIRRRLLINYRADPDIVRKLLPIGMEPDLHGEHAIVGVCLIRLEHIRPTGMPRFFPGLASENGAHRIAVRCDGEKAVYIPRRDTSSRLNHWVGGRLFPGEHALAEFDACQNGSHFRLNMASKDQTVAIQVSGKIANDWPQDSCFPTLEAASAFFRGASLGYSATRRADSYDGVTLELPHWSVMPFTIDQLTSSYFGNKATFPSGSLALDHALFMQDQAHRWLSAPSWKVPQS